MNSVEVQLILDAIHDVKSDVAKIVVKVDEHDKVIHGTKTAFRILFSGGAVTGIVAFWKWLWN